MGASIYQKKGVINYSPILSMDYLFSTGVFDKIDFLKIDCEGAEKEIFEGLSDDNLKRIKKISLEFHKNLLSEEFSDELIRRMTRNDFKVFQMFIGNGDLRIYNFWKS
jgi:hypothetical protein